MAYHFRSAAAWRAPCQSWNEAFCKSRRTSYLPRAVWMRPRWRRSPATRFASDLNCWEEREPVAIFLLLYEDLCEVEHLDRLALAVKETLDLHEAARVIR